MQKRKRIIKINLNMIKIMMLVMNVLLVLPLSVNAEEILEQGNCGAAGNESNVSWKLSRDGVLTISGTGAMADYDDQSKAPWYEKRLMVKEIVIEGVTVVGKNSFCEYSSTVNFVGDSVVEVRESALAGTYVEELPKSLKKVGEAAFRRCGFNMNVLDLTGIENLGQNSFSECKHFDKIIIPGTIKTIPSHSIPQATIIEIEDGVERIEDEAVPLGGRVYFPSTIKYMADYSFGVSGITIYGKNDYTHEWAYQHGCKYVDINKKYDITECFPSGNYKYILERYLGESSYRYYNNNDFTINWDCSSEYGPLYPNFIHGGVYIFDSFSDLIGFSGEYNIKDDRCGETSVWIQKDQNDYSISVKNMSEQKEYDGNAKINDVGTFEITLSGHGLFYGEKTVVVDILAILGKSNVSLEYDRISCDGTEKKPVPIVMYNGRQLTKNVDYTVEYSNNIDEGKGIVTIVGKGLFVGELKKEFEIYKTDLSSAEATLSYTSVMHDGTEKKPSVTVKCDNSVLVENKDYRLDYINNTTAGAATVKVIGINGYKGTIEKKFEIQGYSIAEASIILKECIYSYDGSPKTPMVSVKLGETLLVKDKDYVLTYENNVKEGTAHVVVTGTGIYEGVIKTSFVILPYNAGMDAVYPDGTLIDGNFVYGVMDDEANEVEVFCSASKSVSKLQIPATITDENGVEYKVTSIGNKAFYKNTKLTSVVIGNNVKSIEDYAFYGCKNIKTLKLGSGIEIIGNSSFRKCTKLTTVTLPKSIDSLGKNAFYGCSKLKTITINANSVIDVKANAIKGISKKAVIKVPSKLVKKYKKEFDKKSGFKGGMKIKKK